MKVSEKKVGKNHKQLGNFFREIEAIRRNQVKIIEKTMVTEMMIAFDRVISRLDTDKEKISEDRSIEITQSETQREKSKKIK